MLLKVMTSSRAGLLGLAVLATACTAPDPTNPASFRQGAARLNYEAPVSHGETGGYFRVAGASRKEAVAGVVQGLKDAGYTKLRADVRTGNVWGATSSPDLLDCGTFVVTTGNRRTRLAGTTADSALPAATDGAGELDRRKFSSQSKFTIHVARLSDGSGYAASIAERHRVQVVWTAIARKEPPRTVRAEFTGRNAGSLGEQETCRSSGSIRRILAQP